MELGGHRTATQARQPVSISSVSPFLSSAVILFSAGYKYSPHPSRFDQLSLSPAFSTRCALLLRSFALLKRSTGFFSYDYALFHKNTGGGGTPSANSNSFCGLCARSALSVPHSSSALIRANLRPQWLSRPHPRPFSEIANFTFSIASAFRMKAV